MASEALGLPYSWGPGLGGAVGYKDPYEKGVVCGGLYHVDENWNAFWFNGGLPRNKRFLRGQDTFNITHWALDRTGHDMHW